MTTSDPSLHSGLMFRTMERAWRRRCSDRVGGAMEEGRVMRSVHGAEQPCDFQYEWRCWMMGQDVVNFWKFFRFFFWGHDWYFQLIKELYYYRYLMIHQLIQLLESEQQAVDFWIKLYRFVPGSDLPLLNFFPMGSRILHGCRVSSGSQSMIMSSRHFQALDLNKFRFCSQCIPTCGCWIPGIPPGVPPQVSVHWGWTVWFNL